MQVDKFKEAVDEAVTQYNKYITRAHRLYDGGTRPEKEEMMQYFKEKVGQISDEDSKK